MVYNIYIYIYILYNIGDCDKDDPCKAIRSMDNVSECRIWDCSEKNWKFPKWGIILIVVGGVVILGCIITVLLICRRLKKKKAKGGNEYVTLFGETDSKAIEPPIITN